MAGHPIAVMHFLQPVHVSALTRNRSLGFNEIHARRAEDNRRRALERNRLRDRIDTLIKMMGVGELDAFHAQRLEDAFDRKRRAFRPHERVARARMRLPARHGRGGIVEHAHRDVVLVVYGIGNARDAAREKRRIAHESKLFRRRVGNAEALRHRDARAHTQTGIHGIERLGIAQGVTADIARKDTANAHFLERLLACVKRTTMGAACAQHRWACGKLDIEIGRRGFARTSSRIGAFFNFTHELVARNTLATQQGFIEESAQTLNNIIGIVLTSIAARARRTAKNPRRALASRRTQARPHERGRLQ